MRDSTAACKGPTLHLGILVFQCRCCLLSFRNNGLDRPPRSRPIHAKRSGLLLVGVNRVRIYSMTANWFSRGEEIPKTSFHKLCFVHRRVGELFILIVWRTIMGFSACKAVCARMKQFPICVILQKSPQLLRSPLLVVLRLTLRGRDDLEQMRTYENGVI